MSYRVHNTHEVRERLKEYGSPSADDIRNAHGAHQRHDIDAPTSAAPVSLVADATPGLFEASVDELTAVRAALGNEFARLPGMIAEARQLQSEIKDGHGPISQAMSTAFAGRADDLAGVPKALTEYQSELGGLIAALDRTIAGYQEAEDSAHDDLRERSEDAQG